jgi:hypothetical protein
MGANASAEAESAANVQAVPQYYPSYQPVGVPTPSSESSVIGQNIPKPHINQNSEETTILQHSPIIPNSDGYKWRKYGQKTVKGSRYPRNYYKCTFPGCEVKKYVEQCEGSEYEKVSYKGGEHNHDPTVVTRISAANQAQFTDSVISTSSQVRAL